MSAPETDELMRLALHRILGYQTAVDELRRIHWDRNGYCNECGGHHPCLTLRTVAGVVATGDDQ